MTESLSSFASAYIECALWSSNDSSDTPLDASYDISDLAPDTLTTMEKEANAFHDANRVDIEAAELTDARAGHNFWLNRNGHGSGFWDEYSKTDKRWLPCERLSDASKAAGERSLYAGDDGLIYQS